VSVKIITTSDGSHSLLNETLHETYHSIHGAMQESVHVFIKNGLECALGKNSSPISIFEVGFGTGLNALLTFQFAKARQLRIRYTTIEPSPVPEEIWSRLNYSRSLGLEQQYRSLQNSEWEVEQMIEGNFTLLKLHVTLQQVDIEEHSIDLVYYDAFAPSKQPELWELPLLEKISRGLKPGGFLVTYCAKGQLKRDLKSLGLTVETLPGPPGKKEMVRASKP
jgi:tRNA U34 5-methylaminomethyl-2-thiouridine-forming methyltransferase MnmC